MINLARRTLICGFVVAASLAVTQSAEASFIDFGSAGWAPAGSQHSVSQGGITVTATAPAGSDLSWTAGSGFGVDSSWLDELLGTCDEINSVEILSITLPTATTLSGFMVSNLFTESMLGLGLLAYHEVGYYSINGGQWTQFVAPNTNTPGTNGLLHVGFAPTAVSTIAFGLRRRRRCPQRLLRQGHRRRVDTRAHVALAHGYWRACPRSPRAQVRTSSEHRIDRLSQKSRPVAPDRTDFSPLPIPARDPAHAPACGTDPSGS